MESPRKEEKSRGTESSCYCNQPLQDAEEVNVVVPYSSRAEEDSMYCLTLTFSTLHSHGMYLPKG